MIDIKKSSDKNMLKTKKFPQPLFDRERNNKTITYYIYPTHGCNLRCDYCFYHTGDYKQQKMTDETIEKTIDFIKEWELSKNINFHFFGGEPLFAWDVVEKFTLKAINVFSKTDKKITFSMTTNGTLFTTKILEFVKKYFKANHPFLLSLDGPEHIHNLHRKTANNKGSFELINLNEIKKYWQLRDLEVRPTYTLEMIRKNYVGESIKWLYKQGFRKIAVEWDYESEYSEKDYESLKKTVWEINNLYLDSLKRNDPLTTPKTISIVENLFYQFNSSIKHSPLCGTGRNVMAIDSRGQLWPCQRWAGHGEDIVGKDFILGTVENGVDLNKLFNVQELYRDEMFNDKINCNICPLKPICYGGCHAELYALQGDRRKLSEKRCTIDRLIFDVTMKWFFASNYYFDMIKPKLQNKKTTYNTNLLSNQNNNNSCGLCKEKK